MRTLFITLLLVALLNAFNPKVYAALGDVIYNNIEKIANLEKIAEYSIYKDEISKYVTEVSQTKKMGFTIESTHDKNLQKEYLKNLRKLSKQNDFFVRSAQANYFSAIKSENNLLFSQMVNSGLIDTQKHKDEIMEYYFEHSEDINASGVIQTYLDEDAKLKAKRDAIAAKQKTKKMREKEKIARIRANDLAAQRQLEEKLQEEVNKKKLEIRENQKKELIK